MNFKCMYGNIRFSKINVGKWVDEQNKLTQAGGLTY